MQGMQGEMKNTGPTSGSYNQSQGGAKVWGNPMQQDDPKKKGMKQSETEGECEDREMYVSITGTNETSTATLLL